MSAAHITEMSTGSFPDRFAPRTGGTMGPPGGTVRGGPPKPRSAHHLSGSTAVNETHSGPRHVVGSALRAVRVFADTAFRVVVLGPDGVKE